MTVKQFEWIDRDQAARDLLQLVYHAPRRIRLDALRLLRAIRSPAIIPDLKQIVCDTKFDGGGRIFALYVISHTPVNFYMPELAPFVERDFAERKQTDINEEFSKFLPSAIAQFIDKHPTNRQWFWEVLEQVQNPDVLCAYLLRLLLNCTLSSEFRASLVRRLVNLLEEHPHLMTMETANRLYSYGGDKAKRWLNKHIGLIPETYSIEPFDESILGTANRWKKLRIHLSESHSGFEEQLRQYRADRKKRRAEHRHYLKLDLPDFRRSPVYRRLNNLYQLAQKGNKEAYQELARIAKSWRDDIPVRAVATHFLGKLQDQYDSTATLLNLLFVDDEWNTNWSPIRREAGEALLNHISAHVWERIVESYFLNRQQAFSHTLQVWIAYHTDRLSGNDIEYGHKPSDIDQRIWFRALAEISETDF